MKRFLLFSWAAVGPVSLDAPLRGNILSLGVSERSVSSRKSVLGPGTTALKSACDLHSISVLWGFDAWA